MSNPNVKPSDRFILLDAKDPASYGASTITSGWLAAKDFANFLAVIETGAMVATSTVDAKLQQASDSGGTGVKDITGKAITQLTAAGTDDNKQVFINLRPEELDLANSFTHFRLSITIAVAASILGAQVYGIDARYAVATDDTTVDEVIS